MAGVLTDSRLPV